MSRLVIAVAAAVFAASAHAQTQLPGRIEHVDRQARILVVDGTEYTVSAGAPIRGTPTEPGRLDELEVGMDVVVTVLEATPGSHRGLITSVVVRPQ